MTEEQVRAVGPAFARYLAGFERFFDPRSVPHLRDYCRGPSLGKGGVQGSKVPGTNKGSRSLHSLDTPLPS